MLCNPVMNKNIGFSQYSNPNYNSTQLHYNTYKPFLDKYKAKSVADLYSPNNRKGRATFCLCYWMDNHAVVGLYMNLQGKLFTSAGSYMGEGGAYAFDLRIPIGQDLISQPRIGFPYVIWHKKYVDNSLITDQYMTNLINQAYNNSPDKLTNDLAKARKWPCIPELLSEYESLLGVFGEEPGSWYNWDKVIVFSCSTAQSCGYPRGLLDMNTTIGKNNALWLYYFQLQCPHWPIFTNVKRQQLYDWMTNNKIDYIIAYVMNTARGGEWGLEYKLLNGWLYTAYKGNDYKRTGPKYCSITLYSRKQLKYTAIGI